MKHIFRGINWGVIMLFAIGGMLLFQSIPEDIIALKPAISFEELLEEGTQVKAGDHVSGKVPSLTPLPLRKPIPSTRTVPVARVRPPACTTWFLRRTPLSP